MQGKSSRKWAKRLKAEGGKEELEEAKGEAKAKKGEPKARAARAGLGLALARKAREKLKKEHNKRHHDAARKAELETCGV